jgi:hypothetical protein
MVKGGKVVLLVKKTNVFWVSGSLILAPEKRTA